jgi:transketolase
MNDQAAINIFKGLIIDGVHKANAGHPGGAMSSIDFVYILFKEYLRFDPKDPQWMGRDRFVLSAGHESMLLYSMLHAIGWLPLDELKRFRKLHSKTPGHPENILTPGVECTTGPLGQGAAMSVGFAIAAAHLGARLDDSLFSHRCFAVLGDGCMQEDVTLGAASYAGHLKLGNLIWYYDRNAVQISGKISRSTSDDEAAIFRGFGWNVVSIDGHDHGQIRATLDELQSKPRTKPTLIIGRTKIAHGAASMEGSHHTHGAPLPPAEREATKKKFGIPDGEEFYLPESVVSQFRQNFPAKAKLAASWHERLSTLKTDNTSFAQRYEQHFASEAFIESLPALEWPKSLATRNAFGDIIARWAEHCPKLVGGSADLEPSNMTEAFAKLVGDFQADHHQGRNFAFGVREFPMSAVCNGMALHGGLIVFDATFLCFSDYARPALRLGAIQQTRVIHEYTHDSFYLGEDGPTHQAIEHVMSLRLIPDLVVMRPADALETEVLMRVAMQRKQSQSAICLSRQKLPALDAPRSIVAQASKGAYILRAGVTPEWIVFATGSEVSLAEGVAAKLEEKLGSGKVRVVSVPSWELFFEQSPAYQAEVLAWNITKRISIEAGVTTGWQRFTGAGGLNIGIDHFGASAPAEDLAKEYGFTIEAVCDRINHHTFKTSF